MHLVGKARPDGAGRDPQADRRQAQCRGGQNLQPARAPESPGRAEQGAVSMIMDPADFDKYLRADIAK